MAGTANILLRAAAWAFKSDNKAFGIQLKDAAKLQEKHEHAYKLLLAYAEHEQASVGAPNRDNTFHYNTQQMRMRALKAAKEAG